MTKIWQNLVTSNFVTIKWHNIVTPQKTIDRVCVLGDAEQIKVGVVDGEVDADEPGSTVDPEKLLQFVEPHVSFISQ